MVKYSAIKPPQRLQAPLVWSFAENLMGGFLAGFPFLGFFLLKILAKRPSDGRARKFVKWEDLSPPTEIVSKMPIFTENPEIQRKTKFLAGYIVFMGCHFFGSPQNLSVGLIWGVTGWIFGENQKGASFGGP